MATPTSQRVSIVIIMTLFLGVGAGGTVLAVLSSRKSDDTSKVSTNTTNTQGGKMDNFTPVDKVEKLEIKDLKLGNGAEVKPTDVVTVHYTGAVAATGVVFQTSHDNGQPVTFPLNGVIKGWTDGVPGMKVGGTRRLIIPAEQAYGPTPPEGSGIPANAPLVFDIELIAIVDAPTTQ